MRRSSAALAYLLPLVGCSPSSRDLPREKSDAGPPIRLWCVREGERLAQSCTVDRVARRAGTVLVVRWPDGGFRRLLSRRGGGVEAADGGQSARLSAVDNGTIEVAVGVDRIRLPVTLDAPDKRTAR